MTVISTCLQLCILGLIVTKYASTALARKDNALSDKARSCTKKQIIDLVGYEVEDFLKCAAKSCGGTDTPEETSIVVDSSQFRNHGLLGADLVGMKPADLRELIGLPSHLAECVAQSIATPSGYATPDPSTHEPRILAGYCDDPGGLCKEPREKHGDGLFWTRERDAGLDAESTRHGHSAPATPDACLIRTPTPPQCRGDARRLLTGGAGPGRRGLSVRFDRFVAAACAKCAAAAVDCGCGGDPHDHPAFRVLRPARIRSPAIRRRCRPPPPLATPPAR